MFDSANNTYAYVGLPYHGRNWFRTTFRHESVGHGLGQLGDEYYYTGSGQITASAKSSISSGQRQGIFLNLSLTDDSNAVPWAHLIGHPNYPEVGIYQGGHYYEKGVWRSEANGIMRTSSDGYFNTFCRELIVKRILTLAGEEYTFEKFLAKDVPPTRTMLNVSSARQPMDEYPHYPPIFIDRE